MRAPAFRPVNVRVPTATGKRSALCHRHTRATVPAVPQLTTSQCALRGYAVTPSSAAVTVRTFDRRQRARRALAALGASWAGAAVSLFIPLAHFVLVPSLLGLGGYLGWSRWREDAIAIRARGTCPDCGAEQDLEVHGPWRLPQRLACRHCRRALTLREPEGAVAEARPPVP